MDENEMQIEMQIDTKFMCTTSNQLRGVDFIMEKKKLRCNDPLMLLIADEAAKHILRPSEDWDRKFKTPIHAQESTN
jgi:hypothetical protein